MIVTKIAGGLGNQMFQYACGRALAEYTDSKLKLDLSFFNNNSKKSHDIFYLDRYKVNYDVATAEEINSFFQDNIYMRRIVEAYYHRVPRIIQRFGNIYYEISKDHINKVSLGHGPYSLKYYPKLLNAGEKALLQGYWQTEKYFSNKRIDISGQIREEFTLKHDLRGDDLDTAKSIGETTAVSLHVRRGDYADRGFTIPLEYYGNAITRLSEAIKDFRLFVFSDNIEWVRENLQTDTEIDFVTHNDAETSFEDIRLMSMCDHHIIANSTFSWWGAWLNPDENKRVIAPQQWKETQDVSQLDVLPADWEVIEIT